MNAAAAEGRLQRGRERKERQDSRMREEGGQGWGGSLKGARAFGSFTEPGLRGKGGIQYVLLCLRSEYKICCSPHDHENSIIASAEGSLHGCSTFQHSICGEQRPARHQPISHPSEFTYTPQDS